MQIHYNAFISYRHHPDDIRVAQQIHRALERFYIPKAIRKKRAERGNLHLFRDKEELPITSNLNDDIDEALRNSDYLIVICSVHTKESVWVQREIELFLQTHHRSKVLTVLASGEPYDVIPEILLKEQVKDPQTGEMREVLVEPLSCDWRMSHRKAVREELPRLAAPLLGCAYDELRQRQRQYRTRRLTAILSAAVLASLGLAAYFLQTSITIQRANVQIQANLEQSQKNQSRHLATAAQERLTEGDRLSAIALAMAALPGETNPRPYVPEAELVLSQALGVYQPLPQVTAVGAVSPAGHVGIQKFWVSEKDQTIYLYDTRRTITAFDTQTMEKRFSLDLGDHYLSDMLIPAAGNMVVYENNTLTGYTPEGQPLWSVENVWDIALMGDDTVLAVAWAEDNSRELLFLDAATGKPLRNNVKLNVMEKDYSSIQLCQTQYDADEPVLLRYGDLSLPSVYYLLEPADTQFRKVDILDDYLTKSKTCNGKVFTMGMAEGNEMVGSYEGNRVAAPIQYRICCFDRETGKLLWETSVHTSTYSMCSTLEPVPGKDWLLCQRGSVFQVLDMATGETIGRCETGSNVMSVLMGEQYAACVLEDGYRCNYWYEENYCYEAKCMDGPLDRAVIGDGLYGLKLNGTMAMVYREQAAQTLWTYPLEGYSYYRDIRVREDQILIESYENICLFDGKAEKVRWQIDSEKRSILDFSQDGSKIWCVDSGRNVTVLDVQTGKTITTLNLNEESAAQDSAVWSDVFLEEDMLFYVLMSYDREMTLICLDLTTQQQTRIDLRQVVGEEDGLRCKIAGKQEQYVWLWFQDGSLWELDLTTQTLRKVLTDVELCPNGTKNDQGLWAWTDQERILLVMPGEGLKGEIQLEEAKTGSLCFWGDQLLALCDDGFVYRFDASGHLLSKTQLQVTAQFASDLLDDLEARDTVIWQFTQDGKLILNAFRIGNVIDTQNWKTVSYLTNLLHFQETENRFLCRVNSSITAFPRYSMEQLLELGEKTLDRFELTPEQKTAYGLE